jgi:hypothetical protein
VKYFIKDLTEKSLWPPDQVVLYILLSLSVLIGAISLPYVVTRITDIDKPKGFIRLIIIASVAIVSSKGIYYALKEIF